VTAQEPVLRVRNQGFSSNTYLCRTGTPGECLLIDPGLDLEAIEAVLAEHRLTPSAIYCTHGHFDHIGSADHFRLRYEIPVHLDTADIKVARASNFMLLALKVQTRIVIPEAFVPFNDQVSASDSDGVQILRAPGHTPGSVVVVVGEHAFTGDTMYRDDVWRMPWPEENGDRLVESVRSLWELLPDDTFIHPGHGGAATFGEIKNRNVPMRRMLGLDEMATT
jgi:hydroxyacylglutathione hydrolase